MHPLLRTARIGGFGEARGRWGEKTARQRPTQRRSGVCWLSTGKPKVEIPAESAKVPANYRLLLGLTCLSLLTVTAGAAVKTDKLPQAVVAYGFLASHYFDFYETVTSGTTDLARDMRALREATNALGCVGEDIMWGSHKAFIVPSSAVGQWIGSEWSGMSRAGEGTLFATEPLGTPPRRVWVIVSRVPPEQTTVFWLEVRDRGYVAGVGLRHILQGKDW